MARADQEEVETAMSGGRRFTRNCPATLCLAGVCSLTCFLAACSASRDGEDRLATLPTPSDTGSTYPAEAGEAWAPETERQRIKRARHEVRWIRLVLDQFWSRELEDLYGVQFDSPETLVRYHGSEAVGCGTRTIHSPQGAFYCAIDGDEKVAIDVAWLAATYREHPYDAVSGLVMAHEWGHAVQDTLREQQLGKAVWRPSYRRELNADCLAGSFIGYGIATLMFDVDPRNPLGPGWYLLARSGSGELGDPGAHGTSEQRQQAFVDGVERGTLYCQSVY